MRKLAVLAAGLLFAVPAFAKVVTFEYTGVISSLVDDTGSRLRHVTQSSVIPGSVKIGDTFHGTFSYDTSVPLTVTPDGTMGTFYNFSWASTWSAPPASLVVDKSGTTITSDSSHPSVTVFDSLGWSSLYVNPNSTFAPGAYTSLSFAFYGGDGGADPQVKLPTSLDVNTFWQSTASFTYMTTPVSGSGSYHWLDASGDLTSVTNVSPVPEPEAYMYVLAGMAVAGVGAMRKRRSTSR
jgi:hypothetical protein